MSEEILRINNISEVEAPAKVHGNSAPSPANISLMGWIYFLLLDTYSTNQTSANIRSKQLELSAKVEDKLNQELMDLELIKIPTAQYKEEESDDPHWDWKEWEEFLLGGGAKYSWHFWRKEHWEKGIPQHPLYYSTHKKLEVLQNQGAIINGHSQSNEQDLLRSIVTSKLTNERQESGTSQQLLGSLVGGAMQGVQEAVYMLQQVKEMTFKILNRRVDQ